MRVVSSSELRRALPRVTGGACVCSTRRHGVAVSDEKIVSAEGGEPQAGTMWCVLCRAASCAGYCRRGGALGGRAGPGSLVRRIELNHPKAAKVHAVCTGRGDHEPTDGWGITHRRGRRTGAKAAPETLRAWTNSSLSVSLDELITMALQPAPSCSKQVSLG